MALTTSGSLKQRADELCAVNPTPRTLRTRPPPFPPTTPLPLSPPALPPLTTGSAPPPPGPCSPPVVWGPRWSMRREATELVRPATGSGSAAAHRASPQEATGGSLTSARGHSSWFCMAATSSWCEAEVGGNARSRLLACRRMYVKKRRWRWRRRRENRGLNEAGPGARLVPSVGRCPFLSAHPPPPLVQSEQNAVGIKEDRTGNMTQEQNDRSKKQG